MEKYKIFYHISVGTIKEKCPMCEGRKVNVYINGAPIYCKGCNGKGYILIDGWKIDKCNYGRGYQQYIVYKKEIVNNKVIYNDNYNDEDCFATKKEAKKECDRRNGKTQNKGAKNDTCSFRCVAFFVIPFAVVAGLGCALYS